MSVRLDRVSVNFALQLFDHLKNLKSISDPRYQFLRYHQNVVRAFVNDTTIGSRGLLVYHEMGTGKSWVAAAVGMDQMDSDRHPIVLLTKSLQANLRNTLVEFIKLRSANDTTYTIGKLPDAEIFAFVDRKFSFVSMNASNMYQQMIRATETEADREYSKLVSSNDELEGKIGTVLSSGSLDNKILIVDEAHNLFRSITNGSKNGKQLYDMVMKAKNLKIIFLTGTPISNDPFELVPCMNMLAGSAVPLLPESYVDFYKYFVDKTHTGVKNANKLQNRLMGLVSHVSKDTKPGKGIGLELESTSASYPEVLPRRIIYVPMDPEQYVVYRLARDKELEEAKRNWRSPNVAALQRPKNQASSSYRQQSRQLGNFCPPKKYREGKFGNINMDKLTDDEVDSAKLRVIGELLDELPGNGYLYSQFTGAGGLASVAKYLKKIGWKLSEYQDEETVFKEMAHEEVNAETSDTESLPEIKSESIKGSCEEYVSNLLNNTQFAEWVTNSRKRHQLPQEKSVNANTINVKDNPENSFYDEILEDLELGSFNIVDCIAANEFVVRTATEPDLTEIAEFANHSAKLIQAESQVIAADDVVVGAVLCIVAGVNYCICSIYVDKQYDVSALYHQFAIAMQKIITIAKRKQCKKLKFKCRNSMIPMWFGGETSVDKLVESHIPTISITKMTQSDIPAISAISKFNETQLRDFVSTGFGALLYSDGKLVGVIIAHVCDTEAIADEVIARNSRDVIAMQDFVYNKLTKIGVKSLLFNLHDGTINEEMMKNYFANNLKLAGKIDNEQFYYRECDLSRANDEDSSIISPIIDSSTFDMTPLEYTTVALSPATPSLLEDFSELSSQHFEWPYILYKIGVPENLGYILLQITHDNINVRYENAADVVEALLPTLRDMAAINAKTVSMTVRGDPKMVRSLVSKGFTIVNTIANTTELLLVNVSGGAEISQRRVRRFAIISGAIKPEVRERILKANSDPKNMHGGIIDFLLISAAGAEGLDLKNQRFGIVMEPYWVFARIKQIDARGARANSHVALPKAEQNFQPILLLAVKPKSEVSEDYADLVAAAEAKGSHAIAPEYYTTDLELFHDSLKNESLISGFNQILKSVAIECMINGEEYCRVCAPNGSKLFTNDIDRDMQVADQCEPYVEKVIKASEIVVDGKKYYYMVDDHSVFGYRIYEFDDNLNSHRQMREDSALFEELAEKIDAEEKK